jgi:hypothetical protein
MTRKKKLRMQTKQENNSGIPIFYTLSKIIDKITGPKNEPSPDIPAVIPFAVARVFLSKYHLFMIISFVINCLKFVLIFII